MQTHGALIAGWQAYHAGRIDIRRAMKRIHADEIRHAALEGGAPRGELHVEAERAAAARSLEADDADARRARTAPLQIAT
jgi:hypothetical protein